MRGTHHTGRVCIAAGFVLPVLCSAAAAGQSWITFENETAFRLAPEPGFPYAPATDNPLSDTQEKDYGIGDLDLDGDADVVVVRKQQLTTTGKRKAYIFLNEHGVLTNRTNQLAPQLLEPCNNHDVVVADVTNDGWPDVVTAVSFPMSGDAASIKMPRVYVNLGDDEDGNWLGLQYDYADQRIPDFPTNPFFSSVEAGDVDNDSDLDLFFVDFAADSSVPNPPGGPLYNRLLKNDGDGFFTDVTQVDVIDSGGKDLLGNGFGSKGAIADMNGDDLLDLLAIDTCSANPRTVRYAENNFNDVGVGRFVTSLASWSQLAVGDGPYDFDVGDINNDSKLDFYEVDDGPDHVFVQQGSDPFGHPTYLKVTPTGQLPSTTSGFGGNTYMIDLNNDGFPDQLVCDQDIDLAQNNNRMVLFKGIPESPYLTNAGEGNTDPFILGTSACTEPLCTRDTFDVAVLDLDGNGKLDLIVGTDTGTKVFLQPPIIPPGPDEAPPSIAATIPADGSVDHLQDQTSAGVLQGVGQIAITFSEIVRDAATDGPVTPASFSLMLTTNLVGLTAPTVVSALTTDGLSYDLALSGPIPPGAWTTLAASVEDGAGNPLNAGAVDVGFLPGDVSGNGVTDTGDLLALVMGLNDCAGAGTCSSPAVTAAIDVNRNGIANTQDLLRVIQLLNGVNTQNPWTGVSLPPQP